MKAKAVSSLAIAHSKKARHNRDEWSLRRRGSVFRTIDQIRRMSRVSGIHGFFFVEVAMLFRPGPGWVVVHLGLTLLAAEFVWARRVMDPIKARRSAHEGLLHSIGSVKPVALGNILCCRNGEAGGHL